MIKRHAFTLIELLVVVAIISVPAALLLPVFATPGEAAEAAAYLAGKVADDAGRPVSGAILSLFAERASGAGPSGLGNAAGIKGVPLRITQSLANGSYVIRAPRSGRYRLRVSASGYVPIDEEVTIPAAGPRFDVRLFKPRLTGRVVTTAGKPLPGATVRASITDLADTRGQPLTHKQAITGAGGRFQFNDIGVGSLVSLVISRPGFIYASGGVVKSASAAFEVTAAVMARVSRVAGLVDDPDGRPAAGAVVVCPAGGPDVRTKTDAVGHFVLKGAPEGMATLTAVDSQGQADRRVRTGAAPVALTLKAWGLPAPDVSRAAELLAPAWKKMAPDWGGWMVSINMLPAYAPGFCGKDPDLAVKIAAGPDGKVNDSVRARIIRILAESNPARAMKWAPDQLKKIQDPYAFTLAACSLAVAERIDNPALAQDLYTQAKARAAACPPGRAPVVDAWMAGTAARLGNRDAPALLERVRKDMAKQQEMSQVGIVAEIGATDVDLCIQVAAGLAPEPRAMALFIAANSYTFDRALENSADAEKLLAELGKPELGDVGRRAAWYGIVAEDVIPAIGAKEPARALAIARQVRAPDRGPICLALAARYQPPAAAAGLFREAAAAGALWPLSLAEIAAISWEKDPALARKLFARARASLESRGHLLSPGSEAVMAFWDAREDPADSRLMLERAFAMERQRTDPPELELAAIARGMAGVDIDRAIAIARRIQNPLTALMAQEDIAGYFLKTPDERLDTSLF
ncbi:MAG TPA: prepilin-type N-terminal cleavage/methylation domain-containing protein [Armatimonadota bacterium]|nr:prepilin-type N-terminal cleavage/methylation domain-containing protein [Armatimonadota bacterium]